MKGGHLGHLINAFILFVFGAAILINVGKALDKDEPRTAHHAPIEDALPVGTAVEEDDHPELERRIESPRPKPAA